MAQSTFNDGDALSVVRTTINSNANDAEGRVASLEASSLTWGNGTGVSYFGGVTINANLTTVDMGAVKGWVMTQPIDAAQTPSRVFVDVAASSANVVPGLLTYAVSLIAMDSSGVLQFQNANVPWTEVQRRTLLLLGNATHIGSTITKADARPNITEAPSTRIEVLADAIGAFNTGGNVFSPAASDMTMLKSVGTTYSHSSNYGNDIDGNPDATGSKSPDMIRQASIPVVEIQHATRSAVTSIDNDIDPDNWDNAGVLTALANNKFTIQRIYLFQDNNVAMTYGQVVYSNQDDAIAGVQTEDPVILGSITTFGVLRGYVICKKGDTDANLCVFIRAAMFDR